MNDEDDFKNYYQKFNYDEYIKEYISNDKFLDRFINELNNPDEPTMFENSTFSEHEDDEIVEDDNFSSLSDTALSRIGIGDEVDWHEEDDIWEDDDEDGDYDQEQYVVRNTQDYTRGYEAGFEDGMKEQNEDAYDGPFAEYDQGYEYGYESGYNSGKSESEKLVKNLQTEIDEWRKDYMELLNKSVYKVVK